MTTEQPFDDWEFDERVDSDAVDGGLILDLDGFEGPLDVLLVLARKQKVDLTKISILQLADQYLAFIGQARQIPLEIAAEYLVMAAWLAYLKSRLLLPDVPGDEEPSAEEMAAALKHQLRRLEAMRDAAARLMARPLLGRDIFPRGAPEGVKVIKSSVFEVSLFELLAAYAGQQARTQADRLTIEALTLYTIDDALKRLSDILGTMIDWEALMNYLPAGLGDGLIKRSAVASTFAASLELVRVGKLQLRQLEPFGPIYVRRSAKDR